MFFSNLLVLASSAQTPPDWDVNYTKTIDDSTKASWCGRNIYSCKIVCYTQDAPEPKKNTCDTSTLDYDCLCGDGAGVDLSLFADTMYAFQCAEVGRRCQTQCTGKTDEQSCKLGCNQKYKCPTDPPSADKRVPIGGKKGVDVGGRAAKIGATCLTVGVLFLF